MIFDITGADSKTAVERTVQVSAKNEQHAAERAKDQGVHPHRVVRNMEAEKVEASRTRDAREHAWAAQEELKREELKELANQKVTEIKKLMRVRLEAGKPVFLYDSIYVPVDSMLLDKPMNDGFDISKVRELGLAGWDVVQVIPRTIGIGLENTSSGSTTVETWGGGSGGNVAGVYLVIKKSISIEEITDATDDEVALHVRKNFCKLRT